MAATLIARHLACEAAIAAALDEQIGLLHLLKVQCLPPDWSGCGKQKQAFKCSTKYKIRCTQALAAFEAASRVLPHEWMIQQLIGKMKRKIGAEPLQYLRHLALSAHLAAAHAGGMLEPLYMLHASRLKLLDRYNDPSPEVLRAVSKFPFDLSVRRTIADVFEYSIETTLPQEGNTGAFDVLRIDCINAMKYVLGQNAHFHRARYRLARTYVAAGDVSTALDVLRPLFMRARSIFGIAMEEIRATNTHKVDGGSRGKTRKHGAMATSPATVPTSEDSSTAEITWGSCPASVSGNGLEENCRKYAAAQRRCLRLYLQLLAAAQDIPTLDAASSLLSAVGGPCSDAMPDISRLAYGYFVTKLGQAIHCKLVDEACDTRFSAEVLLSLQAKDISQRRHDPILRDLLERAWNLCMRHLLPAEAALQWELVVVPALTAVEDDISTGCCPVEASHGIIKAAASPLAMEAYATCHIVMLASTAAVDSLSAIAAFLRRRRRAHVASNKASALLDRLIIDVASALLLLLLREVSATEVFVGALMQDGAFGEEDRPPQPQHHDCFILLKHALSLYRMPIPVVESPEHGPLMKPRATLRLTGDLLIRCYIAYQSLCGFRDLPHTYSATDAAKGSDAIMRASRTASSDPRVAPVAAMDGAVGAPNCLGNAGKGEPDVADHGSAAVENTQVTSQQQAAGHKRKATDALNMEAR